MAEPAARTDVDALRLSIQRGFAGVPPDTIVALLEMLDELVSVREERDEALSQVTAILAETTRWQREAQSTEERAWANVHHASVTRMLRASDKQAGDASPEDATPRGERES